MLYLILGKNHVVPKHPAEAADHEWDAEVVVHHDPAALEAGGQAEDAGRDQKHEDGDAETSYRHLIHCHSNIWTMNIYFKEPIN